MFCRSLTLSFFCASMVLASFLIPVLADRTCGTVISSLDILSAEETFQDILSSALKSDKRPSRPQRPQTIGVVWHVISKDNTDAGGNVADSLLHKQMDVLNKAYIRSGLTFALKKVTRTVNPDWFDNVKPGSTQQDDMKHRLREGGASTLNVYSVGLKNSNLLGYATFPAFYTAEPWNDGVVLHVETLPNRAIKNYNVGHVFTHETGHWCGLYHTFEGGCIGAGDYVDDTPYEASPASGCPEGRDTCPLPGLDPIHNYMDYSYTTCMHEFTPGQIRRQREALFAFRGVAY